MGFSFAVTAALGLWIILWALGAKGFDAFLVSLLVIVVAVGVRMLLPYLPGARHQRQ
jgi:hypothetical protein